MSISTSTPTGHWLTSEEAAAFIALTPGTLANWRSRGIGPKYAKPSPKRVLYRDTDLEAWVESTYAGEVNA